MEAAFDKIDKTACDAYAELGAICLRGVFNDWIELLRAGVARNYDEPGPYFSENVLPEDEGSFWDDYCNWERIPEFHRFITESDAARLAAQVMRSDSAQFFHDHVLVKEPNTAKPTPWHQDAPYYFAEGRQTVSFWLPLDPVSKQATLRMVAASHRWPKMLLPVKWLDDADFYADQRDGYMALPDLDHVDNMETILEWDMQPGDAVLFDFCTVHGARGNLQDRRRRAFSMRWLGDDGHYTERPGRTSPPYPGHDMQDGQKLREDWFPILWPKSAME
ncbi:MAG: phytanoyl-CoA dioxygenase [Gammaproteobacteria bacterium]|nr:phytanoyl-CoA dioxygenase [Gammaproteobacteria bacterium]MCP4981432.1 phytanoyl-CoA dioxygenase [Gammaproteobacteria bacterium]